MIKICTICNKQFIRKLSQIKKYGGKYCSKSCANVSFKGKHLSSTSEFKKGMSPWNKGKKTGYAPWLGKKRPNMAEENAYQWKGDEIGYFTLHKWVYRHLGKPTICEHCGTESDDLQWANKSQQYKRRLDDWLRLCVSCHRIYDNSMKGAFL